MVRAEDAAAVDALKTEPGALRVLRILIDRNRAQREANLTMLALAFAMGALDGKRGK